MKQILIISAVFPPEPVVSAKLSRDIASELSKESLVTVLCPNPTRPHGFLFDKETFNMGFKVIRLKSYTCSESKFFSRLRESYSFGKCCAEYIIENRDEIDLIYANTWPIMSQYLTVRAAKKNHIPIAIHVQDVYPESLSNKLPILSRLLNFFLLPIDKYVLRNSTKIIAISDQMKLFLKSSRKIESQKIIVVRNWQDEGAFINFEMSTKMAQVTRKRFTFMYLGNIGPVAGVDFLIEAFNKAGLEDCRLVIAGNGSMKEVLKNKVDLLGLSTVEFWSVPDGKVPEVQYQADILLLPIMKGAASTSIPSKLPAYMFSRRPIIATVDSDCDTARVVQDADCGWVLPPENIYILASMLRQVVAISQAELQKKGENGYCYATDNLSKSKNLSIIVNAITTMI